VDIDELKWNADGLMPVVIAGAATGAVLTLAWANREALEKTLATRETHLFSRSRNALWRKGETSGNTQHVVEVVADCDADALLYRVDASGPACHTGAQSCFHNVVLAAEGESADDTFARAVAHLEGVLAQRKVDPPEGSYVAKLYAGGVDRIGKKIGEEATEVVIAAKNDNDDELVWEASDLIFHLLALLAERNIPLTKVGDHLLSRINAPRR
jgi:phosphoribosyl-ATP pyrophosphohydrolase/phosphoribosyl-AMP cyclohydrolase